jgi:hypothetical protein
MAFTVSNDYLTGRKPVPTAESAHQILAVRYVLELAAADLALNTLGAIGKLPAGHVPVGVSIDGDDFEGGAAAGVYQIFVGNLALRGAAGGSTVTADAKNTLISTYAADGGGAWGDTGAAVATAFDKEMTRTLNNMASVTSVAYDRDICMKVTTAPSATIAGGTFGLTLFYRPA